ncbi:hypothetical protein F5Y18DRAFT_439700 [Xylariaceae sp. FL1019]|nr:hypothetical protein F5Y18DRAFT_439700 [Xylariaceae sp. FL1019]
MYSSERPLASPARVSSDAVVPLGFYDDTMIFRIFVLGSMFVFNDVLDPQKLRSSLERLAQRDGWKRIGARLRKNDNGALEHHIPAEFSEKRPAITFTHVSHSMNSKDHPIASLLPLPGHSVGSSPAIVVSDTEKFAELYEGPGIPKGLDDYLLTDRPAINLHIVSFNDITVMTLHRSHTTFDGQGQKDFLEAWSLMMQGREDEIKTPFDMAQDPLRDLGTRPSEPHVLASSQLKMLQGDSTATNRAPEEETADVPPAKDVSAMIRIPGRFVEKLRAEALESLKASANGDEKPFVSEGDVIVSWFARLAAKSNLGDGPDREMRLTVVNGWRYPLSQDLLPAEKPYLGNAMGFVTTLAPASDIINKPISWTASQVRRNIVEQGTREQLEAYCAMMRESKDRLYPVFGDASAYAINFSNWTKVNYFNVDFSAAAVKARDTPCTPFYLQQAQYPLRYPEGFYIGGKDDNGDYWLWGYRNEKHWEVTEKLLAEA